MIIENFRRKPDFFSWMEERSSEKRREETHMIKHTRVDSAGLLVLNVINKISSTGVRKPYRTPPWKPKFSLLHLFLALLRGNSKTISEVHLQGSGGLPRSVLPDIWSTTVALASVVFGTGQVQLHISKLFCTCQCSAGKTTTPESLYRQLQEVSRTPESAPSISQQGHDIIHENGRAVCVYTASPPPPPQASRCFIAQATPLPCLCIASALCHLTVPLAPYAKAASCCSLMFSSGFSLLYTSTQWDRCVTIL